MLMLMLMLMLPSDEVGLRKPVRKRLDEIGLLIPHVRRVVAETVRVHPEQERSTQPRQVDGPRQRRHSSNFPTTLRPSFSLFSTNSVSGKTAAAASSSQQQQQQQQHEPSPPSSTARVATTVVWNRSFSSFRPPCFLSLQYST